VRAYLLKRLLLIPITLIGITFITFIVMKLAPGDPSKILRAQAQGTNMQAAQANLEALENWKKERHLDKPIWRQYAYWLQDLLCFDLGRSLMTGRERVSHIIFGKWETKNNRTSFVWGRVWITLAYSLVSFALMYLVAIPVGIVGGAKQFTLTDRILTVTVFLLYSLPSFWIGTILIAYCTSKTGFPTTGYYGRDVKEAGGLFHWIYEIVRHGTLPIFCMTYGGVAFLSRQMRSSLLEQIRQDFVRTARAKGLSERVVILRHATRNALIPIITLFGNLLPAMIAGSVILEQLFSIPGMGQLFFNAINERDYNVIMGIEVVSALLTLFGMLVSDILYVVVNPTIAYD
jgi:peptide/nickel transport system permease protein